MMVRTGCSRVGNCETDIVEVDDLISRQNLEASVCLWTDVMLTVVDRLQCHVARQYLFCAKDERRISVEKRHIIGAVSWSNVEEVVAVTHVPVWTVSIHQRHTRWTYCRWNCVWGKTANHVERRSALTVRRQNNFIGWRHCHRSTGLAVDIDCFCVH